MKAIILFHLLLLIIATTNTVATTKQQTFKKHLKHYPTLPIFFENTDPSTISFVTQRQDHFDGSNANTWEQAYYVNDTFWKGDGPVFLCVGGEGPPLTQKVTVDSVHCSNAVDWLEETNALFFAVEHRYYGCHNMSACPVDNFDNVIESLKFLSSRQALADLANFHTFATEKYNLSGKKWVSWGGSYPGMLAGWFRLKFPHLVHAAVASSAPVHTKLEMNEYNDHVRFAYTVESVGGSEQCAKAISDGHVEIGQMMNDDSGRSELVSKFISIPSADWLKSKDNQRTFAGEGVAYFPSQGNDPSCTTPACDIRSICEIMLTPNVNPVDLLAKVFSSQNPSASITSSNNMRGGINTKRSMMVMTTTTARNKENSDDASLPDFWSWQTCNEMGFYQTCDVGSDCMYVQGLDTLSDAMAFCTSEFKIDASVVAENVNFTDVYYGSIDPVGTRVLWPNGEVDPWSTLSVLKAPCAEQPVLYVKGASHHFWTHPTLPTDQHTVEEARLAIRKQVEEWLMED